MIEGLERRFERKLEGALEELAGEKLERELERSRSLLYSENLSNITQRYRLLGYALVVGLGGLLLIMLLLGLVRGWSVGVMVPSVLSAGLLGIAIQVFRQVNRCEDLLLEAMKTWDDSEVVPNE